MERDLNSAEALSDLINTVSKLRDPLNGCPWDLEQSHTSLIPFVIEEAYEVVDAIRNQSDSNLKEELGDLLLQIILHSQIASEDKRFNFKDIVLEINKKLIRRHPHVFETPQKLSAQEVKLKWEERKSIEKSIPKSKSPISDNLKRRIRSQPPLSSAMKISKKVCSLGFDWKSVDDIWKKIFEEINELKYALNNNDLNSAEEELGDVLFTLINIARWYRLCPEEGLAGTNKRFLDRFAYIESSIDGVVSKQDHRKLEILWEEAKQILQAKEKGVSQ